MKVLETSLAQMAMITTRVTAKRAVVMEVAEVHEATQDDVQEDSEDVQGETSFFTSNSIFDMPSQFSHHSNLASNF